MATEPNGIAQYLVSQLAQNSQSSSIGDTYTGHNVITPVETPEIQPSGQWPTQAGIPEPSVTKVQVQPVLPEEPTPEEEELGGWDSDAESVSPGDTKECDCNCACADFKEATVTSDRNPQKFDSEAAKIINISIHDEKDDDCELWDFVRAAQRIVTMVGLTELRNDYQCCSELKPIEVCQAWMEEVAYTLDFISPNAR